MNLSDTAQELNYISGATGPGSRLRAARIDRGLAIEDVATRMHLSTSIIDSIEQDDFDAITAPIFVKGYLRAYARIVSLNEDELIAQYVEGFSDSDPAINTTSSMAAEITVDDARVKWTTYLVILVLIVLLGIWWWNKNQNRADVFSLDALQTESELQSDFSEDTMKDEIETLSETIAGATDEIIETQAIEIEPEVSPVPEAPAVPEVSQSNPVVSEEIQQEQIVDTELAEDIGESAAISRLSPIGSDQLIIIVHADTWADIKDSGGHQLAYDLLRAGQELKMTGQAPFAVFLGNGHGVELIYKNESIDLTNNIRDDNTARLKIGS